ncbi:MAG TPA: cobalamin-dependent protein [Candidatus Nanopelagicales bacterium]|nr:cobalamin-dependent protein [Candidatus Nanopelagicales bacterium]
MSDRLPNLPPVDPARAGEAAPATTVTPELLAGLLADGDDELAAWALGSALAERRRAEVFDGLLREAMALVGQRWKEGRWTVAEEHLASQTLARTLERIHAPQGPAGRVGPLAVLAGVAGEHHAIGLICLDQVLREEGWTVANLGADVPAADLARFLARNRAELVALAASLPERTEALRESVAAAGAVRPDDPLPILVGGALAGDAALMESLDVAWAGTSLTAAAAYAGGLRKHIPDRPADEAPELP